MNNIHSMAFLLRSAPARSQSSSSINLGYGHGSRCSSLSLKRYYEQNFSSQPLHQEVEPADPPHFHEHDSDIDLQTVHRNNHSELPGPKIGRLVLVRHGQSEWNVTDPTRNLTARFTGWADIGLTQQGRDQAVAAGRAVKLAVKKGILPYKELEVYDAEGVMRKEQIPAVDVAFCSLLKRAADTMNLILNEIHLAEPLDGPKTKNTQMESRDDIDYHYHIPIIQSWRLNERHYGALVGLSKEGAERLYGKIRLTRWRDSWDVPPPPMPLQMLKKWDKMAHCQPVTIVNRGQTAAHRDVDDYASRASCVKILEHAYKHGSNQIIPETTITNDPKDEALQTFMPPSESLYNTYERFMPLWLQGIIPHLRAGRTVLVVGHANTIRSMLFAIDPDIVTKENSKQVKIPSALPLVYEFVDAHQSRLLGMIEENAQTMMTGVKDGKLYINGRECSKVVPGNLRVIKPLRHSTSLNSNHTANEVIYSDEVNRSKKEMKYSLNGVWVETEETKSVSFCTEAGRQAGEQDIA